VRWSSSLPPPGYSSSGSGSRQTSTRIGDTTRVRLKTAGVDVATALTFFLRLRIFLTGVEEFRGESLPPIWKPRPNFAAPGCMRTFRWFSRQWMFKQVTCMPHRVQIAGGLLTDLLTDAWRIFSWISVLSLPAQLSSMLSSIIRAPGLGLLLARISGRISPSQSIVRKAFPLTFLLNLTLFDNHITHCQQILNLDPEPDDDLDPIRAQTKFSTYSRTARYRTHVRVNGF
jgi:hypothetical protein